MRKQPMTTLAAAALCAFFAVRLAAAAAAAAAADQPFDAALGARLGACRAAVSNITASAEVAAARILANPYARLKVPREECAGLNEELIARAGGLSQIGWSYASSGRATPDDIQLFAVRDWESFGPRAAWLVDRWRQSGNLVVVFGSAAGRPEGLNADFFIDNGAPDGTAAHASVNAAANVVLAWMWCCEYASAFSRKGLFPAVTKGIVSASSWGHNEGTSAPDGGIRLYRCDTPVAAGDLAVAYLNRVAKLVSDIREPPVTHAFARSAEIIADRLAAGRRVAIAGLGHMILEEPKHGLKSPMIGFRAVSMLPDSFAFTLEKGDVIVWVSYSGMNSSHDDYAYAIRRSGADIIFSGSEATPPAPDAGFLDFIPQPWSPPDAEVAIPVPPYAMAPVSALARILVLRLLDEEVVAVLRARGLDIPRPGFARPDAFRDYGQRAFSHYYAARRIPDPDDRWGILDSNGCVAVAADFPDPLWITAQRKAHGYADGTNFVFDLVSGAVERKAAPPAKPRPPSAPITVRRTNRGELRPLCTNGLWGAVSKSGQVLVEPRYDNLRKVNDDLLIVQIGERYGLVGGDGREIVPVAYDLISPKDGFFVVGSNLVYAILAPDGSRFLTDFRYDRRPFMAGYGLITGSIGKKTGLYGLDGREVLPPVYDGIGTVATNYVLVQNESRWRLEPTAPGAPAVTGDYARIRLEPSGGFLVEEGRLFGFLSASGEPVTPIAFERVSHSRDGATGERIVRRDGELLVLAPDGATRPFPFACDHADFFFGSPDRKNPESWTPDGLPRLYRVAKDGRWGVVDDNGGIVLPLDYAYVSPANERGHALVATGGVWRIDADIVPTLHGAKWGAVNAAGKTLVQPLYDGLDYRQGFWPFVLRKRHTLTTP